MHLGHLQTADLPFVVILESSDAYYASLDVFRVVIVLPVQCPFFPNPHRLHPPSLPDQPKTHTG